MKHKHHEKDSGLDKQQVDNEVVDPAEAAFLELLGQDIDNNPERLIIATKADRAEIETLIGNVKVDIDTFEGRAKRRSNKVKISNRTLKAVIASTKQARKVKFTPK